MKEIPLSQGKIALVDDADFDWLSQWKWSAKQKGRVNFYAVRQDSSSGTPKHVYMHRVLCASAAGVDHIDGNGLNNQRSNLRPANQSQNIANSRLRCNNRSGFKGVGWHKAARKWRANITLNYRFIHLGLFDNAEEAARAYDVAAAKNFGSFALLNFPSEVTVV